MVMGQGEERVEVGFGAQRVVGFVERVQEVEEDYGYVD